jgi:hypothetical protein
MEGGKTQRTFKKAASVKDTQCIYNDKDTFCKYLTAVLDNVAAIHLYHNTSDDQTILLGSDAKDLLAKLTSSQESTFTKTFVNRKSFEEELATIVTVVDLLNPLYYAYVPIGAGKASIKQKPSYGLSIIYKGKKRPSYHTFVAACDAYLDDMALTETQYKHLAGDLLEVVHAVNNKGYLINGLSHSNIGYFKEGNHFKLLDWQYLQRIVNTKKHKGYMLYAHPLKSYLTGSPAVIAKKNMSLATLIGKNKWIRRLSSFELMNAFGKASFEYIAELKASNKKWVPFFDNYALAVLLLVIAEKNNIKAQKVMIDKLIEPFIPAI